MNGAPPITDSPWLWSALFTGVGLAMLLATDGKFGDRQARIERKGQAQHAAASNLEIREDSTGRKSATNVPRYSQPGETEITLTPLKILLGILCGVSLLLFVREQLRMKSGSPSGAPQEEL